MTKNSKLIVQGDYPLIASPTLAKAFGVASAHFLQKLHYCLNNSEARVFNNQKYFYHTFEQWVETLGFYSVSTIKRVVSKLKNAGILMIRKLSQSKWIQTNFYSIDYKALKKFLHPNQSTYSDDEKSTSSLKSNNNFKEIVVQPQQSITSEKKSSDTRFNTALKQSIDECLTSPLQPMANNDILDKMSQKQRAFYLILRQKRVDIHFDDALLIEGLASQKTILKHIAYIKDTSGHLRYHWHSPEALGLYKFRQNHIEKSLS